MGLPKLSVVRSHNCGSDLVFLILKVKIVPFSCYNLAVLVQLTTASNLVKE